MQEEETESTPKIKFYHKGELAALYKISLNTLYKMIKRHEAELIKVGYFRSQKVLTPLQVRKLFELIGEP